MQPRDGEESVAAQQQFWALQEQLRTYADNVDLFDQDDFDILVMPSLSMDQSQLAKISGVLHYEERLLFSLIRLRNPLTRLIYVTAQPLAPMIVDYYLQLLPGIPFSHARDRLLLLSTHDGSLKPLSQKVLERPRLLERIRQALRPGKSYMVCYNSTPLEQELSVRLGIPLLASSPDLRHWGSKSGSREIFAEAQIACPDGSPIVWSRSALAGAIAQLWARNPHLTQVVVKLNEGFSGEGNALLELRSLQAIDPEHHQAALFKHLDNLRLQAEGQTVAQFLARLPELGAIAEVFIEGEKRSPSFQGYITPTGQVKILSTHDQILGGPDGQIYLGCRFPADAGYRVAIQQAGVAIGKLLAQKGALECYGVDFVVVRRPETATGWDIFAIEINLRKGGTTHPFMALKLLTNGQYQAHTGCFFAQNQIKHYVASDNLQKARYQGLLPSDLMDIMTRYHLHFDTSTKTGTVFHLMGALSEFGKLGLTSIGNSFAEAESHYAQVEAALDQETKSPMTLPAPQVYLPMTWSR